MTGFSPAVRALVAERSNGVCEVCGNERALHHHHRRARNMGSTKRPETNMPANAIHACARCHTDLIEKHRSVALLCGWLVGQYSDPGSVPLLYRGVYVRLDDDGGIHPVEEKAA